MDNKLIFICRRPCIRTNFKRFTMTKARELSLIAVIVILVAVVAIQSITNSRILSLIGQQPQQLLLPALSTILNGANQLQKQITEQNNNKGECAGAAVTDYSFAKPSSFHNSSQIFSLTGIFKQVENSVVGNAKAVDVTFVDGNTYAAKVIGTDPFSDIAIIQITDNFSTENVLPLIIANSSSLQVGQQVIT